MPYTLESCPTGTLFIKKFYKFIFCLQLVTNYRENKMKAVRLGKWSERPDELFQLMARYPTLPDVKVS